MEVIRSQQNSSVKTWMKLQTAKGRKKFGSYLLEGEHLVLEAIQSGVSIQQMMIREDVLEQYQSFVAAYPTVIVSKEVFQKLANTSSSQGIIAVVPLEKKSSPSSVAPGRYLLLDAVQDPGNVGTIIRTADAAGFDGVFIGEGSVDLYNDKVVRSMQGSQFHIPIYHDSMEQVIEKMHQCQIPVAITALHTQAVGLDYLTGKESIAIIMGNEGNGVRESLIPLATKVVKIPMYGKAESLNVAIAASILMYQTRLTPQH